MPDYSKGKIYSIRSHKTDDIYIGSTTQSLYERLRGHKRDFENWKKGYRNYVSSYEILKYNDAYIELIEEHSCENKDQLRKKEGQTIRATCCVNKRIAGRTTKEYQEENKEKISEYQAKWYIENKEKVDERNKKYNEDHKGEISEYQAKYYQENKEKIYAKQKTYNEENKEKISEKKKIYHANNREKNNKRKKEYKKENEEMLKTPNPCPCGSTYQKRNKAGHKKTKGHQKYLNNPNSKYCRPCL